VGAGAKMRRTIAGHNSRASRGETVWRNTVPTSGNAGGLIHVTSSRRLGV